MATDFWANLAAYVEATSATVFAYTEGDSTVERSGIGPAAVVAAAVAFQCGYRGAMDGINSSNVAGGRGGFWQMEKRNGSFIGYTFGAKTQWNVDDIFPPCDLGIKTTLAAAIADATTTAGIQIASVGFRMAKTDGIYIIKVDDEMISFTGYSGTGPYTLSGVTRGYLNSCAMPHSNGASASWCLTVGGPTSMNLPSGVLDGTGVTSASVGATFVATVPAWWPTASHAVKVNNEYMTCTRSGSTFTTTGRGQNIGTAGGSAASTHAGGSPIGLVYYNSTHTISPFQTSPLPVEALIRAAATYGNVNPAAASSAVRVDVCGMLTPLGAGGTFVNAVGNWAQTGNGLGAVQNASSGSLANNSNQMITTDAAADAMESTQRNGAGNKVSTIAVGIDINGPTAGPFPGRLQGYFNPRKSQGLVQMKGFMRGGHCAAQMLAMMMSSSWFPATLDANIDAGLKIAGTTHGGSGKGVRLKGHVQGHNDSGQAGGFEAGPTNRTAYVDPAQPWTIRASSTAAGGGYSSGATSIAVADATNFPAGGGSILNTRTGEWMLYTAKSGNTLTGVYKGYLNTTDAAGIAGDVIAVGYDIDHPDGFAASIYGIEKLDRARCAAMGMNVATDCWSYYQAAMPTWDTATAVSGPITTLAQREHRLRQYAESVKRLEAIFPNFRVLNPRDEGIDGTVMGFRGYWDGTGAYNTTSGSHNAAATTITMVGTAGYGSGEKAYFIKSTGEMIKGTVSSNTLINVTRGAFGTTAATIPSGSSIQNVDTIHANNAANEEFYRLSTQNSLLAFGGGDESGRVLTNVR